jgi:hypothetical protein
LTNAKEDEEFVGVLEEKYFFEKQKSRYPLPELYYQKGTSFTPF